METYPEAKKGEAAQAASPASPPAGRAARSGGKRRRRSRGLGAARASINAFYLPAVALFSVFVVYPLIRGVWLSFTNWNGYSQTYRMNGLANYQRLIEDPNVHTAFINTIVYGLGSTLLQNVLGLAFALLLNNRFRGRTAARTLIYLPVMIAPLIMGYVMYFFVRYNHGAFNDILGAFGVAPIDWMAEGPRAVAIITLVNTLQFVGVAMVIYLAGLQSIPAMYYEAASLDGASPWRQFRHVTLPMLVPAITSAVMINLIGGLKLFDVIMALAGGGYSTASLSTLINRTYFGSEAAGYASAIGIAMFLFIMAVSAAAQRYLSRKEVAI
ncbi:MAG: sugar ABC transporter permease [Bifidobacteriaceae bacterium]|jgi:raffinose/stachyose/melibiose transport system permease protein|nr:sugar ABC transporter permease [Bifidobacteriaceae bacterium]